MFCACSKSADTNLLIASASNLQFAFNEIEQISDTTNNFRIDFTYGSSGSLTQRAINGAPYDMIFF